MGADTPGNAVNETRLPRHVAIIMDGNGRWAKQRNQPRHKGHRAGVEATRAIIKACAEKGIQALTLFAFSSENWRRPKSEVSLLMELFVTSLRREVSMLNDNHVRLRVIGDINAFPAKLQSEIRKSEQLTEKNTGLILNIAANYGGRWDIAQAAAQLAREVAAGKLDADDITPEHLGEYVTLADCPEPDLFIRTGGERRISNFLLWHLAYTELYFTDCLWPDFDIEAFEQALRFYTQRERRFGRTSEQLKQERRNA